MRVRTFTVLFMAAFSAMLGMGIISPFLPDLIKQHGANGFWVGMIFAGFGISRAAVMPFVGKYSDRTGRKIFVCGGLALYSIISLFYPGTRNTLELTAVRLIHGLAAGMIMPIVVTYVGELAEKGKEGLTTGTMNMMFYTGLAAGPFLGGIISQRFGFDEVFYFMSALGAVTFAIVLFFLPEVKGAGSEVSVEDMHFHTLVKYNFIKAVLVIAAVCTLLMAVFMSFVPSLAETMKVDTRHIGMIISTGILFAGMLQIPFGKFADRLGNTGRLLQASAGTATGMMALFAMPFCPGFGGLMTAGIFVGIGAAISTPALTSISVRIGQKAGMGTWMGIFYAAMSVGFVVTPLVAGIVMDHMGIDAVFYLFGLTAFFGNILFAHYVFKRLRGELA